MDRNLQPQVESDCSQKVKNVGQLVIGGSAFALLGAFGQFNMPRIGEMGHFAHDMVPVLLCMGAWGVATGIGLLRAWPWARISMLVFSSLLAVYGMSGVVIFLLMPSGGMSGWPLLLLKTGTVALHLIPIAIGVRWFIYFTRTNVKAHFQSPRKAPLAFASAIATVDEAFRPSVLPVPAGNVSIADYDEPRKSMSSFRRWLLLYKPPRGRAWIARPFFYVMVAETVFLPLMLAASPGDRQAWPFIFLSSLFWIAVLRALSVWLEKPRSHSQGS